MWDVLKIFVDGFLYKIPTLLNGNPNWIYLNKNHVK